MNLDPDRERIADMRAGSNWWMVVARKVSLARNEQP